MKKFYLITTIVIIIIIILVVPIPFLKLGKYDSDPYACNLDYKLDEKCKESSITSIPIFFWSMFKLFPYK
jgi:hypothetical protein